MLIFLKSAFYFIESNYFYLPAEIEKLNLNKISILSNSWEEYLLVSEMWPSNYVRNGTMISILKNMENTIFVAYSLVAALRKQKCLHKMS